MASIKAVLYTSKKYRDGTHPIMLQFIHERKVRRISLNHSLLKIEWNNKTGLPKSGTTNHRNLTALIRAKLAEAEKALMRLEIEKETFHIDELISQIKGVGSSTSFKEFAKSVIESQRKANRIGNANSYKAALSSLSKFMEGKEIRFTDIDYRFLKKFEEFYLSKEGNSINGFNVYMRSIRAIYNRAIKEGLVSRDYYPFNDYQIKQKKTRRRAISREEMIKIASLKLTKGTPQWDARNYFLFSFFTIGMSWVDMALLQIKNINGENLFYKRSKTGKEYIIRINENISDILQHYTPGKTQSDFLFPIITRPNNIEDRNKDIKNGLKLYNKRLKEIAKMIGSSSKITSYVSRHSWASIANFSGTPLGVIQQGMGHESSKITQDYLKDFDTTDVDSVNENILKL